MAVFLRKDKPKVATNPMVLVPDYSRIIELTSLYIPTTESNVAKLSKTYTAPAHGYFHWSRKLVWESYYINFYIVVGTVEYQVGRVSVGNDGGHCSTVIIPMAKNDILKIEAYNSIHAFRIDAVVMYFTPCKLVQS